RSRSPAIPLPPIPRTTTFSTISLRGSPDRPRPASAARSTCSGSPSVTSSMPRLSRGRGSVTRRSSPGSLLEGRADPVGLRLVQKAIVLGIGDRLGLVDEHDRDVVADGVPPVQPRVVQGVLVDEIQQRTLVLRARQDRKQLGVECHLSPFSR